MTPAHRGELAAGALRTLQIDFKVDKLGKLEWIRLTCITLKVGSDAKGRINCLALIPAPDEGFTGKTPEEDKTEENTGGMRSKNG